MALGGKQWVRVDPGLVAGVFTTTAAQRGYERWGGNGPYDPSAVEWSG